MNDKRKNVLKPFEDNREYMKRRIESGIENNRKGFATISFKDSRGTPLSDINVVVKQKNHEFQYGANLFMLDELESEEKNEMYRKYFKDAFNLATLPFYWKDLEPKEGVLRFTKDSAKIYRRPPIDLCLEYCERYGITPKAHCLMYDQWSPDWIVNGIKDVAFVKDKLEKRFQQLSERYADKIHSWEVTNETLFTNGKTVFFDEPDLVEWSFNCAKHYFTSNELIINEAHCNIWDVFNGNRSQYYMQIERALNNGAKIDAIGMQYHMFFTAEEEAERTNIFYDPVHMYKVLDYYARFKKPIQITELTVPCYTDTQEDEDIQAEILKNIYSIWFSHEAMESIIYWNLVDGYAAFAKQGDMTAGENYYRGGLLRFDFTPKPAYKTIQKLFGEQWRTNERVVSGADGKAIFKGFYGEYEIEITYQEKTIKHMINFTKNGNCVFEIIL